MLLLGECSILLSLSVKFLIPEMCSVGNYWKLCFAKNSLKQSSEWDGFVILS